MKEPPAQLSSSSGFPDGFGSLMELPPYSSISVSGSTGSSSVTISARTLNIDANASYITLLLFAAMAEPWHAPFLDGETLGHHGAYPPRATVLTSMPDCPQGLFSHTDFWRLVGPA